MYRNEYLKKLVKIFGKSEGESQSEKLFHNFGIRYLQKAPLVTVQDLLGSNIDFAKFDSQYTLGVHRELVNHLKKYEYPNNVKGVLDQYVEKIPNLKNYKFFRLLLQSFNSVTEVQLGSNIDFAKQGIVEGQLDALVNSDQAERNAYKKFVADQAGGNWELGAKLYADLKKRPLTDIFGDDARIKQFMRTKFVFDKFSDKDWKNYWLLSQHADRYINFQKQALINIEKYLGQDNDYYRYLADRISCAVSGQQKYGTQSICGEKGETFN